MFALVTRQRQSLLLLCKCVVGTGWAGPGLSLKLRGPV